MNKIVSDRGVQKIFTILQAKKNFIIKRHILECFRKTNEKVLARAVTCQEYHKFGI
jgi:hypothetical protein